jgi:hypothetical protein
MFEEALPKRIGFYTPNLRHRPGSLSLSSTYRAKRGDFFVHCYAQGLAMTVLSMLGELSEELVVEFLTTNSLKISTR